MQLNKTILLGLQSLASRSGSYPWENSDPVQLSMATHFKGISDPALGVQIPDSDPIDYLDTAKSGSQLSSELEE